jgi:DNA-binding XRE family transcriptional regulator
MFPQSQQALLRDVRGGRTQAQFAELLGVDRSCLSRYESEALGAPTAVINYCLAVLASRLQTDAGRVWPIADALEHAKEVVNALERLNVAHTTPTN